MGKVRIIPSTINPLTHQSIVANVKRKVAAYARVSTDSDEQYTSYEAQVNYYTGYIQSRVDWEYINVYADEGISGTNTKKRVQFNKMIEDALEGKINLIITKSISRFARNTLDTISYIRKLKAAEVEVFFEKENLWTFDSKSEMVLSMLAAIAQEESRSISENVKIQYYDEDGKLITESLKDFTKKNILHDFASLDDFLTLWTSDEKRSVIIQELEAKGIFIEELRKMYPADVDDFDLICDIACIL